MEEPGHVMFKKGGSGGFHFGCVDAALDWRYDDSLDRVDFTFEGSDEGDQVSGRGWAKVEGKGKQMMGQILFHRATNPGSKPERPVNPSPAKGRRRGGQCRDENSPCGPAWIATLSKNPQDRLRSILPKHVRNRALQPVANLLQGLQRHVLLPLFHPLQSGIAEPHLSGELLVREVATLLPQKSAELFCQPLSHGRILCRHVSHMWDFLVDRHRASG